MKQKKRLIITPTYSFLVIRRSFLAQHIGLNRTINISESDLKSLLKTETDQSIDLSAKDKLSTCTIEQLKKVTSDTGIGPIKFSCSILNKDTDSSLLEFLGFAGEHAVLLDANKSERFHGLLVLGEHQIL